MLMSIEIDKSRYKSIASPENFVIIDFYRALSTYRLAFRWWISIDMLRPVQYKKSCPQQMCLPRNSLIFRVYLGVRTCEVFLCFAPFVFLGFIVFTSLCPLLYATREFHRFFHRGWADPIFLDKLNWKGQPLQGQGRIWRFGKCRQLRILSVILTFDKILVINDSSYCGILAVVNLCPTASRRTLPGADT